MKLKELTISPGRQAFIYLFSFFLAPLGLVYAIKYLREQDPVARRVGIIVVILTANAIGLMIWLTAAFARWESQLININIL